MILNKVRLGPSSGTILFSFNQDIVSVSNHPTLVVGGSSTRLTSPIMSGPHIIYPVTGALIAANSIAYVNTSGSWISSSESAAIAVTGYYVDTSPTGSFLPNPDYSNITMPIGFNIQGNTYLNNTTYYSDLIRQAWYESGLYMPVLFGYGESNDIKSGAYVLTWTNANNNFALSAEVYASGNKVRYYGVESTDQLYLDMTGVMPPAVTLYHEDNIGTKWNPNTITRLSGASVVRGIKWFNIDNSNVSTSLLYSDYGTEVKALVSGYPSLVSGNMIFETSLPHGLSNGNTITLIHENIPTVTGIMDASLYYGPAKVLSPLRFSIEKAGTASGVVSLTNTRFECVYYSHGRYDDFIELCMETNSSPWISIPHLATDELVEAIATEAKNAAPAGLPIRVEYTSTHWQSGLSQEFYCRDMGAAQGLTTSQYYIERASEIHSIFRNVFGTRFDDIIGVFTARDVGAVESMSSYADSNNITLDEVAIHTTINLQPQSIFSNNAYFDAIETQLINPSPDIADGLSLYDLSINFPSHSLSNSRMANVMSHLFNYLQTNGINICCYPFGGISSGASYQSMNTVNKLDEFVHEWQLNYAYEFPIEDEEFYTPYIRYGESIGDTVFERKGYSYIFGGEMEFHFGNYYYVDRPFKFRRQLDYGGLYSPPTGAVAVSTAPVSS